MAFGVTNEGGVNGKIRLLRNIMGMWLLERSRDVWIDKGMNADYDYLISKAEEAEPFRCLINPDDHLFLNPPDMEAAITSYCTRTGQPSPSGTGGVVRCILESLAMKYRFVLENMSRLRSAPLERLHIVGGGSKNKILNRFIADATGMTVITGPQEGTGIGNILLQAIANGDINDLNEARKIVARSFETETFHPGDQKGWNQQYDRAKKLFEGKE
jgi:rhamnulokinase